MAYSSLATVAIFTPYKSSRDGVTIDSVAIHTMAGNLGARECGEYFAKEKPKEDQASSNYGIGSDGTIGVYVDESERSWCTSSGGVDRRAVTIEVASTSGEEPFACTGEAYESLIKLLVDICQRNNMRGLTWMGDEAYAQSAAAGGPVDRQNMFVHKWFASKSCPGKYLFERQGQIANEVNKRLKNGITYQGTTTTATTTATTTVTIDYSKFTPYVVMLDRNSRDVPYIKLRRNKVSSALVEAGYLFTGNHKKVSNFENPQLKSQILNLKALELPYGMFMTARAKTIEEAKEEIYQMSFPLRRYTPLMGAWLRINLTDNKSLNNKIMRIYAEQLARLGFGNKMGIICDLDTLTQFDWNTYKEMFFLDLVDHVKDTNSLNTLLDPAFFDVDLVSTKTKANK